MHHAYRFAISSLTGGQTVAEARLAFLIRHVSDATGARFALSADEILRLNPNTGTLPLFRTRKNAEITLENYQRFPVLVNEQAKLNPWGLTFKQGLFNMASDSGLFRTAEELRGMGAGFDGWAWTRGAKRWLPLYEAKMLSHYDHRFSTYDGATQAQLNVGSLPRLTVADHQDPKKEPSPATGWRNPKSRESSATAGSAAGSWAGATSPMQETSARLSLAFCPGPRLATLSRCACLSIHGMSRFCKQSSRRWSWTM